MIRLHITAAAYAAIAASLAGDNALYEPQESAQGGYFIWLMKSTANQLKALRRPGEGVSEVILRLAQLENA